MAILLLCVAVTVRAAGDERVNISVLLSGDSRLYYEAVSGLENALEEQVSVHYQLRTFDDINSQPANEMYRGADFIIAVGSKAARLVMQNPTDTPVLSILVPRQSYNSIVRSNSDSNAGKHSVLYLEQPASRLLSLAKIVAGVQRPAVGMVFGPTSKQQRDEYLNESEKLSVDLSYIEEENDKRSLDAIKSLVENTGVYLALYDRKVMNRKTAKWLLYIAGIKRKPVVGYSQSYVDAGALAAIYTSPYESGENAVDWVIENLANGGNAVWNRHPDLFTVSINRKTARKLNMSLDSPNKISEQIREREGRL